MLPCTRLRLFRAPPRPLGGHPLPPSRSCPHEALGHLNALPQPCQLEGGGPGERYLGAVPAAPLSGPRSGPGAASGVSPARPLPTLPRYTWLRSSIFVLQEAPSERKAERSPGGREAGGGGKGARARGAGAGRRKGRAARPRRPPCSCVRASAPAPCLPLPLHPGEGVPETAPSLTPPPRFPGSSLRRRSSTMPDSFDTLQRQRPEGGGRGERGGRGGGERRKGRCELGRRRAFGTLSEPPHPQSPRNSSVSPAAVSERA